MGREWEDKVKNDEDTKEVSMMVYPSSVTLMTVFGKM